MVLPVSSLSHPQQALQAEAGEDEHPGPSSGGLPSPFTGPCGWPEPLVLNREEQEDGQGWAPRSDLGTATNSSDAPGRILSHHRAHGPSSK